MESQNAEMGIQYFDVAQGYAHIELGKCILEYLQDVEIEQYTPIILCIGTDRATGDCLVRLSANSS